MGLLKTAKIGERLIGPGIARLPACTRGQECELVLGRLRDGVDTRPILGQHLTRSCGRSAEIIVRTGKGDVKFGVVIAARAEVSIHAPQRRRRIIAPTGVIDGVGRDISGEIPRLAASLYCRSAPSV